MIRYGMACESGHEFDGWFRSSEDFDEQSARGLLACPACASMRVRKAVMAPAVRSGRRAATERPESSAPAASPAEPPVPAGPPVPMVAPDPRREAMITALRELKRKVTENADYVGPAFPEQARQMHFGEREHRGIWGEATPQQARELLDDGVAVAPLPVLPEERN